MDNASKKYIDEKSKILIEKLLDHINSIKAHTTENMVDYNTFIEDLDIIDSGIDTQSDDDTTIIVSNEDYEHPKTHPASMILTDPQHRFISDLQLAELQSNKISKTEFAKEIKEVIKESKSYTNTNINNILNNRNVLQNIRLISSIVNQDDNLSTLLTILQEKTDLEAFDKHINNDDIHLTYDNVYIIDQIKKMLDEGIADWNATENDPNFIANKPEALPADGGDADTIDGYTREELLKNKRTNSIVIGNDNLSYDDVDYICDGTEDSDVIQNAIDKLSITGGSIYLREGTYYINSNITIGGSTNHIIICGCGDATKIIFNANAEANVLSNITIKDVSLKNNDMVINGDNIKIIDCSLENSKLFIGEMNKCRICRNSMKNVTINYASIRIYNCIFTENIFDKCTYTEFSGGSNLFNNNIKVV